MPEVDTWLERIKTATNSAGIFKIVDQFRLGEWSDEDRALMARTYIAQLAKVGITDAPAKEDKKQAAAPIEEATTLVDVDEAVDFDPTWYEKM